MDIISDFLNLSQDSVSNLSSYIENDILIICLTLKPFPCSCPICNSSTSHIKEYKLKRIKHSALNHQKCLIEYRARRLVCDNCGKTFYENNPFIPIGHSLSNLTVLNVLQELKESNATFASVARHNFISPTKAQEIFDLYVRIPRSSLPEILCIDEVYALKDNHSKYVCILLDFLSHEMVDMLPDRKKYSLLNYFDRIPIQERNNVKYIIMDMYSSYRDVAHSKLKKTVIAVDSFHVIMNINKALDKVRKRIMKGKKSDSIDYYLLKNFHWLLLTDEVRENKRRFNKRLQRYINYPQILDLLLNISPELKAAYEFKDLYLCFNRISDYDHAEHDFLDFMIKVKYCKIPEMVEMIKTLNNWHDEIINSFIVVNGKRLSNGIMESRNSIVKLIKKTGNGYVNFARFRNRCMYCMNKNAKPNMAGYDVPLKMKGHKRGKYKK